MAPNKRKILETARKLAQKGAKDKALKEYQRLVKLDPKDAKLRLEIGDAHRRWGQVEEAIETYSKVAEQYTKEGFDARAVAVFKQILNLDPNRFESYQPLAELYERMGLTAEAINSLQTAADGFHKQGKKREALDLLRKMATIDPTNTTSRIKVAELLRQEELNEEAITEYDFAVDELERNNDVEASEKIYRRILEIDPDRAVTLVKLARNLLARRDAGQAEPFAVHAVGVGPDEPEHYELLADVYRCQEKEAEMSGVYRRLAELFRERGEEDRARDILQRYVPAVDLAVNGDDAPDPAGGGPESEEFLESDDLSAYDLSAGDLSAGDLSAGDLSGDELLLDHELTGSGEDGLNPDEEPALDIEELVGDPLEESVADQGTNLVEPAAAAPSAPAHDVDADQLLAEASVYLRYGKCDKAISHLERILGAEPDHRLALEKLGEAYAESGESEKAVDLFMRAVKRAREDADEAAVAVLRGRIAALDESAAASLDPPPAAAAPDPEPAAASEQPAPPRGEEEELPLDAAADLEIVVDDTDSDEDEIAGAADEAEIEIAGAADEIENEIAGAADEAEIEIASDESVAVAEEIDVAADAPAEDAEEFSADEIEIDIDVGDEFDAAVARDAETSEVVPDEAPPAVPSLADVADTSIASSSLSSSTTQQTLDDLEEADFYMQQGLLDEAEEIYQRVLAVAPNHPRALARLGEVAAARGGEPEAQGVEAAASTERVEAIAADVPEAVVPSPARAEETAPEIEDDDLADLDIDDDEEASVAEDTEPVAEEDLDAPTEKEVIAAVEPEEASAPPDPTPVASEPALGDGFDLAAELSDAFGEDSSSASFTGGAPDDGFASVFEAFKKGVSEALAEGDYDAHYDLGIAYKEMGLLDDAVQEFRVAMDSPPRRIECLHLIGVCALEAGQPQVALEHLSQLLDTPELGDEQQLAGQLELGRAHQALGDVASARRAFEAVAAVDPDFCGVSELIEGLGAAPEPEDVCAEEPEEFESFEDVICDAVAEDEPDPDPGETFQDLVDEANADPAEEEPTDAVPPAEQPAPASESPGESAPAASPPKKRKKKKISFV